VHTQSHVGDELIGGNRIHQISRDDDEKDRHYQYGQHRDGRFPAGKSILDSEKSIRGKVRARPEPETSSSRRRVLGNAIPNRVRRRVPLETAEDTIHERHNDGTHDKHGEHRHQNSHDRAIGITHIEADVFEDEPLYGKRQYQTDQAADTGDDGVLEEIRLFHVRNTKPDRLHHADLAVVVFDFGEKGETDAQQRDGKNQYAQQQDESDREAIGHCVQGSEERSNYRGSV
jgi:hypothetical protein